jgi:hypothetical protein
MALTWKDEGFGEILEEQGIPVNLPPLKPATKTQGYH